jgi:hypothetical protein
MISLFISALIPLAGSICTLNPKGVNGIKLGTEVRYLLKWRDLRVRQIHGPEGEVGLGVYDRRCRQDYILELGSGKVISIRIATNRALTSDGISVGSYPQAYAESGKLSQAEFFGGVEEGGYLSMRLPSGIIYELKTEDIDPEIISGKIDNRDLRWLLSRRIVSASVLRN